MKIGLLTITFAAIIAGMMSSFQNVSTMPNENRLMPVTDDAFGGPFTLTSHLGKTITQKDFDGQYKLIYFGFTFCPAICPTELAKITSTLNALGDDAKKIQPLFVTVDPMRDTQEKMKSYVALFHPSLVGLTGTQDQITSMTKNYKIYAAKVDDPSLSEYTMDHSSFIYFIAPDGRLLHIFKIADDSTAMTAKIKEWLLQP